MFRLHGLEHSLRKRKRKKLLMVKDEKLEVDVRLYLMSEDKYLVKINLWCCIIKKGKKDGLPISCHKGLKLETRVGCSVF